jgi:FMN phosphatase YigB (HAD superfamily)
MGKIILGLDLDGVLYNYHHALYTFCQYEMNYNGTYNEFWLDYIQNLSKDWQDYLIGLPIPYETQIPPQHVIDFLKYAKENADEIYYITHRPEDLTRITERYLERYNFPYYGNYIITGDKLNACRYAGVTHFIDDFTKHVKAVSAVADSYLMAKPWNLEEQDNYNTVHSLKEFQERVFA